MASRKVRVLPEAQLELDEAAAWLAMRSKSAAKSFLAAYEDKLEQLRSGLVEYPLSHLPELSKLGYRSCSFGSYAMIYYVDEEGSAVVAHLFHQRRNYSRLVLGENL